MVRHRDNQIASSASLSLSATSAQIITSSLSTHPTTFSVPTMAQTTTVTVPDPGVASTSVVLTNGSSTINGNLTVQGTIYSPSPVGSGTSVNAPIINAQGTANQIVFTHGTNIDTIINSPAPGSAVVYTLPDAGGNANFILSAGNQTIGGALTVSNALTCSGGLTLPGITGSTPTTLTNYAEFTQSTNWSGPIASTAATFLVTVIGRVAYMTFPVLAVAGNSTSASMVGSAALPSWMWPTQAIQHGPVTVVSAGATQVGTCWISAAGIINWYTGYYSSSLFPATTLTQGWDGCTVLYTIPTTAMRAISDFKEVKSVTMETLAANSPGKSKESRTPAAKAETSYSKANQKKGSRSY